MSDKEKEEVTLEEEITSFDEDPIVNGENAEINEAQKQVDEYKDMLQRLQAEFDNYRKRNNEASKIARNDGINDVLIGLLSVIDNFERGIALVVDDKAKSGMELICKQLVAVLTKFDVEEIKAIDEDFDPKYHHAIAQCDDAEKSNKIVEVFQKGYKRKDKVLRPALVKVAQ